MKILLVLILISNFVVAQNTQSLISATGEHFIGTNAQISWSIGEPVIETVTNVTNTLTQGFHQTNLTITNIEDLALNFAVTIFPNPSSEILNLEVLNYENLSFQLFDLAGKLLKQAELKQQKTSINVAEYAKGTYLISLFNASNKKLKTYQIIKQ